jgi:hypothetical protein
LVAGDTCDPGRVAVELVTAESSEPDDAAGTGDGATTGDIRGADSGTADTSLMLRAERDGKGQGRVYTLRYRAIDAGGNVTPGLATVTVPHDQGEGPEPLLMQVEPGSAGAGAVRLYWPGVTGAVGYDVIAGDLGSLRVANGALDLGTVRVLGRLVTGTTVTEPTGSPTPAVGEGYFYLIQARTDVTGSGYGTESGPWPRVPGSCDGGCPGLGTTTAGSGTSGSDTPTRR